MFTCAGLALLRAAVRPRTDGPIPPLDVLAADELLMEAVDAASPSLANDVRRVVRGDAVKDKVRRRSTLALAKYHLRMTSRPTPFGLFAGVAPVRFGAWPALRIGARHRPTSRTDADWLDGVVRRLRTDPAVLSQAVLVANNVSFVRGDRLVLPERYEDAHRREASIRFTPLVRAVRVAARTPISWSALVQHLCRRFRRTGFDGVLRQLVDIGVLLTDLDPPPDCVDPLGHVIGRVPAGHPLHRELREIQAGLRGADAAAEDRWSRRRAVATRMRALHDVPDVIQTDLRLDVEATLPSVLGEEAARAAEALWRLGSRSGPAWLDGYRERFLERYGSDRLVPVLELLDDTRGMGLPDFSARPEQPGGSVLVEHLLAAVRDGRDEIEIDDELVGRLAADPPERRPVSMELCAEVLAPSWEALCAGEFRLVIGENLGSPHAGSTIARFAHLVPELDASLTELVRRGAPPGAAQVACRPRTARSANVASVPQRLPVRIPVGCGPAVADVPDLALDQLAVGATQDDLYLVDLTSGARVAPVSGSMLNPRSGHIPPVARFLLELGEQENPSCLPWRWGALSAAPFLPRIRYGRTVLAPARWLPSRDMIDPAADWTAAVGRWRTRWGVPRWVQLTSSDNRIVIDLDDPGHTTVFQAELRKTPRLVVQEVLSRGDGWFDGHACEVVFQLMGQRAPERPVPATRTGSDALQLPGGDWLYAKLYAGDAAQRQILHSRLHEMVSDVDGWHFVRYADPDPHLRIRFSGKPDNLWTTVLPRLHSWASGLRADGLLSRLVLDSYDPEVERYGGPEAIAAAERVFHADSLVALALGEREPDVLTALSVLDLVRHFGQPPEILDWLAAAVPLDLRRSVPRDQREEFAAAIDPTGRASLDQPWTRRSRAIADYLPKVPPERYGRIALSLAHMHCNRLFGIDRAREQEVYALVHGGLALRADRARHGR
ncbi:lantibiotic dehydratase [Amycolatopsis thermophila]|uniref:Thiopeptide-type bacteriocin biosynthesis protein n=1 Tax=Amycolatopsis thermophila TaxID=206084 RepID=A0ABU0EQQ2_9PSEU|nr:lantibiotic dehydratase [Amycolatopsis thermophila]MDQ0377630.1 thiopeptide-type bacteriocin biosynthesis protein [Amycolatopsis thermophila]